VSCDWDVFCLDCQERLGLSDFNHQIDAMRELITAAPLLAQMATTGLGVTAGWGDRPIDTSWFAKHHTHRLIPRSEYGDFDDDCGERFECAMGGRHQCHLQKGHDGGHHERRA
jgi:hypothetical protein